MQFTLDQATDGQKTMVIKAAAGTATTKELVKGLYGDTNYDGLKSSEVWLRMNQVDKFHSSLSLWKKFYFGMAGLSLYNCARMGSLTASGKKLAVGGAALSFFMLAHIQNQQSSLKSLASPSKEEPKE